MNMMSNADVEAFVEARFGEKKAEKLGHIGTGGENNKRAPISRALTQFTLSAASGPL